MPVLFDNKCWGSTTSTTQTPTLPTVNGSFHSAPCRCSASRTPAFDGPDEPARHAVEFWITTSDLPSPDNRVTVDPDGRLRVSYADTNAIAHQRLIDKWKSLLETMQCRDEYFEACDYAGGRNTIEGVSHQNGTVVPTDPTTSALDINCKMHDLDNLYVVDSSFFCSSSAVNPTLTIIANALVAEQIDMRLSV